MMLQNVAFRTFIRKEAKVKNRWKMLFPTTFLEMWFSNQAVQIPRIMVNSSELQLHVK